MNGLGNVRNGDHRSISFHRMLQKVRNSANLGESLVAISEFLTVDYKQSTNW